jgi:type I restriction enzyme S subunit
MENNLPKGWVFTSPFEIAEKIRGVSYNKDEISFTPDEGLIPVLRANSIDDNYLVYRDLVYAPQKSISENQLLKNGDVVLAMSSGSKNLVGKTAQYFDEIKISFGAFCGALRPTKEINAKYFGYYFQTKEYRNIISELSAGTNINNLKTECFEALQIPLPPLPEQHRIVAKLDAVMQKVESNKQRLDKIPKLLKRFRQSVLAAAVNNDGAEEITRNVCVEIQIGPFGTQLHRHEYISNGIPLVNPTHIQDGEIIPDMDLTITKTKFKELPNYHLKTGDVIMGRRGEMARCALVGEKENGWLCGTGSLFFRPNLKKINPRYLYWVLSNSNTKAFLEGEAKGSTMSNLNLNIVRNIPFPLPSLEEQKKIVKQVEQIFAFADKIEARYTKTKTMLDKLPQSILAKAFRGELVQQNENDEPASVLLERIVLEKSTIRQAQDMGKARKVKNYPENHEKLNIAAEKKGQYTRKS